MFLHFKSEHEGTSGVHKNICAHKHIRTCIFFSWTYIYFKNQTYELHKQHINTISFEILKFRSFKASVFLCFPYLIQENVTEKPCAPQDSQVAAPTTSKNHELFFLGMIFCCPSISKIYSISTSLLPVTGVLMYCVLDHLYLCCGLYYKEVLHTPLNAQNKNVKVLVLLHACGGPIHSSSHFPALPVTSILLHTVPWRTLIPEFSLKYCFV